jgi:hypothetical protein
MLQRVIGHAGWHGGRRLTTLSAILALILAGIPAVAAAVIGYGSLGSEAGFQFSQSLALGLSAPALVPASVDKAVARLPEPAAANRRTRAVRVRCMPRGPFPLRNPWTCEVTYRSGTKAHYLIQVNSNGSFSGAGTGLVGGCCVRLPTGG